MKTIKTFLKLAGFCAMAALFAVGLFTGCFSDLTSSPSGEKGVAQLNMGGSTARTAFPVMTGVTYGVTFSKADSDPVTATLTQAAGFVGLAAGTWDLAVEAKNASNAVIASAGVSGIVIAAGETTKVDVLLEAVTTVGTGTLEWSVDFPNDLTSATLTYSGPDNGVVNMDDTGNTGIAVTGTKRSGALNLNPGMYLVTVDLAQGSKTAGDVVAVYVYSGLTTAIDLTFTVDSLVNTKPLALSADIVPSSGGVTVNSAVLTLSGDNGMVEKKLDLEKDGSGNTWKITTSIPETADLLGWELEITTGRAVHTTTKVEDVAYAASLNLGTVNIYTLTATVDANGTLKVNDVSYDGVVEFLSGGSVTLEASGNNRYNLKTLTVDGTDKTSPYEFSIANNAVVAVEFERIPDEVVTIVNLTSLIAKPVHRGIPVVDLTTDQYTGTITWTYDDDSLVGAAFGYGKDITAELLLVLEDGYILTGATFTHSGADNVALASDTVTITFAAPPMVVRYPALNSAGWNVQTKASSWPIDGSNNRSPSVLVTMDDPSQKPTVNNYWDYGWQGTASNNRSSWKIFVGDAGTEDTTNSNEFNRGWYGGTYTSDVAGRGFRETVFVDKATENNVPSAYQDSTQVLNFDLGAVRSDIVSFGIFPRGATGTTISTNDRNGWPVKFEILYSKTNDIDPIPDLDLATSLGRQQWGDIGASDTKWRDADLLTMASDGKPISARYIQLRIYGNQKDSPNYSTWWIQPSFTQIRFGVAD